MGMGGRGCAYEDTCVLGVASTTGGVPSSLGVCIPGCMCTGGWHPLQAVHLHNWGVASTSAAFTIGGVPSSLGVCIPGRMYTGGGIHSTTGGVPSQLGGGIHQCCIYYRGVYLHHWGCAYQDACVLGVASTTGGVPS